MNTDIDFTKAVKTKSGHIGMVVSGQNEVVIVQGSNGQKHHAWEDELTQADDTLKVEEYEVEDICSCCNGIGVETIKERRVVKNEI